MDSMDKKKESSTENTRVEDTESEDTVHHPETAGFEEVPGGETAPSRPGFLDLVYGVLFDPVKTFKKVVAGPPLGQVILIYFLLNLLSNTMGAFINTRAVSSSVGSVPLGIFQVVEGLIPLFIVGGLLLQFIKWFTYSGVLHLIADFFGGTGSARGVFAVYGLAALPGIFLIPFQLLGLTGIGESWLFSLLIAVISIALYIWGVILLILGIREVHQVSTGKAVGVVFTPVLLIVALSLLVFVALFSFIATLPQNIPGFPI